METEILSQEKKEINYVISLAQADQDIKNILLSEITQAFKDELELKKEQIFYQDQVYEIIELARHDQWKKTLLVCAMIEDDIMEEELKEHFYDVFGSNGELRG